MKKGISLILLVITIIIILILAGSVILSIVKNSPVEESKEATFKSNVDAYKTQLNKAIADQYFEDYEFKIDTFDAPSWSGTGDGTGTIKEYIPDITDNDATKFVIEDGKLVYVGGESREQQWLTEMGVGEYN